MKRLVGRVIQGINERRPGWIEGEAQIQSWYPGHQEEPAIITSHSILPDSEEKNPC